MLTTKDEALIRAFYEWGKTLDEARDMWETIFDDYKERLGAKLDIPKLANEIVKLTPHGGYREECRQFFDGKQYDLIVSMIMGTPSSTNAGLTASSAGLSVSNNGMVTIKGEVGEWSAAVDDKWSDIFLDPIGEPGEPGVIGGKWWSPIEIEKWDLEEELVDYPTSADPEIIEVKDEEGKIVWKSRIKGEQSK